MKVLLLDTSLQGALLAVADVKDQRYTILQEHHTPVPQEAAAALPQLCDKLLSAAGLSRDQIECLIVGTGPGSFTGIKIGLSFVYGWKTAVPSLRLYGVSALKSFVQQQKTDTIWALGATQKAGYFASKNSLGTIDMENPSVFSTAEGQLTAASSLPIRVLGAWPKFEDYVKVSGRAVEPALDVAGAAPTIVVGMLEDFVANSGRLSEGELKPLYLRKSAPEEKADKEQAERTKV